MSSFDSGTARLIQLLLSSLATTDALAKLLIENGLVTETELLTKVSAVRAAYEKLFNNFSQ